MYKEFLRLFPWVLAKNFFEFSERSNKVKGFYFIFLSFKIGKFNFCDIVFKDW